MPWFPVGQSYPGPGPPQLRTRLPAASNARTGGAPAQHSPVLSSNAFSLSASVAELRWTIQTTSWSSAQTPIVCPRIQWLGIGFGQNGSTSNRGASMLPCCAAARSSAAWVRPRATSTMRKVPPTRNVRAALHSGLLLSRDECLGYVPEIIRPALPSGRTARSRVCIADIHTAYRQSAFPSGDQAGLIRWPFYQPYRCSAVHRYLEQSLALRVFATGLRSTSPSGDQLGTPRTSISSVSAWYSYPSAETISRLQLPLAS